MDFEYYSKLFASHLDRLLKESEIYVNECARLSGLSAGLISGLARGKINNPSLKTMVAIANLFDLPYSMFLKPYDSEEWQAVRKAARYATSCKPLDYTEGEYVQLPGIILPYHKAAIVMEWNKQTNKELDKSLREKRLRERHEKRNKGKEGDEHDGN